MPMIFCLKDLKLKLYAPTLAGNKYDSIYMDRLVLMTHVWV